MSIEFLRRLPLFNGLSEPDLESLYGQAKQMDLPAGEVLIREGDPGDALYVLLDGKLEVTKRAGAHDVKLDVRQSGDMIGEMSLLDNTPRSASVRTIAPSRLMMISKAAFERMLSTSPSAAVAILHTVMARLRQNEALLHEKEKMAGLGTLAAGLAHELNNPAAAVRRAPAQLRDQLGRWQKAMSHLDALDLNEQQAHHVERLRADMVRRGGAVADLDPLSRSDREGEVEQWLDEHGVEEAWELAPTLVNFGWSVGDFDLLAEHFDAGEICVLAQALGAGSAAYALLDEVNQGAERLSEIVKAVKTYSYLDRAPVQEVDVHEGLDNTLVILRHKLAKSTIHVVREYDRGLPRIEAYASELNQVWTNILDNAIDALNGQGEIRIRTSGDAENVYVELQDNGPGIPADIQSRVFEPFFTTKPPGVGTGLGLNIAYNIVFKHYGEIVLTSRPGFTCFRVRLPHRLPQAT
jgi:signal transduction histidine kinase